jgi:hypothetical protein
MRQVLHSADWDRWIASVSIVERFRSYIQDFAEAARSFGTVEEIAGTMRSKYPDHGSLTTLLFSARAAVKARAS